MKYNDNGEWKDIKVKSYDTLPIGSIVEYNGTTVPDGYEEVETWNLLGTTTGTTELNLSSVNYDELYVKASLKTSSSDAGISIDFHFIKQALTSNLSSYRKGYYDTSSTNGMIYIDIKNSSIKINYAARNGSNITSYSTLDVYYK